MQTLVRAMNYGQCADCVQETSIIPLSSVTTLLSPQPRWAQLRSHASSRAALFPNSDPRGAQEIDIIDCGIFSFFILSLF